jgi:hypothetical protein
MYRTWWDVVLHNWPMTIFVPTILVVLATLAVITRIMDGADGTGRATSGNGAARTVADPAGAPSRPPRASSTAAGPAVGEVPTADVAAEPGPEPVAEVPVAGGNGEAHPDRGEDEPDDRLDPDVSERPAPAPPDRAESAAHGSVSHR